MSLIKDLEFAEQIAQKFGNFSAFQRDYFNSRQLYGVRNSIEMALDKQGLTDVFIEVQNEKSRNSSAVD